jgi:hypothetical protein
MRTHAARKRAAASAQFRALVADAVSPADVHAICTMLSAAAKQGNIIAAKLLFNYLGGPPAALPPSAPEHGGVGYYIPDPRALHPVPGDFTAGAQAVPAPHRAYPAADPTTAPDPDLSS